MERATSGTVDADRASAGAGEGDRDAARDAAREAHRDAPGAPPDPDGVPAPNVPAAGAPQGGVASGAVASPSVPSAGDRDGDTAQGTAPSAPTAWEPAAPPANRNARIVALANQKGGVGKTTTAVSLAAALCELGKRVLLVDFDPQGGCSLALGIEPGALQLSVYNALLDRNCRVEDVIQKTRVPGLDLLPSNIDLAAAELMLVQEVAREQTLMRVLAPLRLDYDFILIDCPPSLGLLTINALTAADGVVIPLECEYYALRGMALLMDSIERVQERLNPRLQVDGILPTMYDSRTVHSREVLARVQEAFGPRLLQTVIRKTIRFAEAPVAGEPILTYAPTSTGAEAYRRLAKEVIERVASSEPAGR